MLEERLVTLGALSDDIEDQFSWLNRTRQSIDEAGEPPTDLHFLIDEITLIKVGTTRTLTITYLRTSLEGALTTPLI